MAEYPAKDMTEQAMLDEIAARSSGGIRITHPDPVPGRIVVGSVVRLRSGGPPMTVCGFVPGQPAAAHCLWMTTDGVAQSGSVPLPALVLA